MIKIIFVVFTEVSFIVGDKFIYILFFILKQEIVFLLFVVHKSYLEILEIIKIIKVYKFKKVIYLIRIRNIF